MDKPEDLLLPDGTPQYEYDEYGLCLTRVFVPKGAPERKRAPDSLSPYLSDETIESLRTLDELENFIQIITKKAPPSSPERLYLRLSSDGPAKKFREEVWPWLLFLRTQSFGKTCRFAFQPHGAQADVKFTMATGEKIPVQITVAVEGEQAARWREALSYHGAASRDTPIDKENKGSSGHILTWRNEMCRVDKFMAEVENLVKNRINKKQEKGYPRETWLLVNIEDPRFNRWQEEHGNSVINTAKSAGEDTSFARIYLLSGETCWQVK